MIIGQRGHVSTIHWYALKILQMYQLEVVSDILANRELLNRPPGSEVQFNSHIMKFATSLILKQCFNAQNFVCCCCLTWTPHTMLGLQVSTSLYERFALDRYLSGFNVLSPYTETILQWIYVSFFPLIYEIFNTFHVS